MSSSSNNTEAVKEQELDVGNDDTVKEHVNQPLDEQKDGENSMAMAMPSPQQEEEAIKKKYGGMLVKKKPLISKDHEHAFFDSADWALGKQEAQKPKGPLDALRPKLQPTAQHNQVRSRRSAYAPSDDCEVDGDNTRASSEDENSSLDAGIDKNPAHEDQSCHGLLPG